MTLKHVKGWYESYNALPEGEIYYDKETGEEIVVTPDEAGNPEHNHYAKNPEKLVPYERYCKPDKSCGYPRDKWDEDEIGLDEKSHINVKKENANLNLYLGYQSLNFML